VNGTRLVQTLFASSFWSLRQQGLLTLDVVEKKRLFIKSREVEVRPAGTGQASGLEGELLETLRGMGSGSADQVVYRWYRKDHANAYAYVIQRVIQEAATQGLLDSDQMSGLAGLGNGPKGTLDTNRVDALGPSLAETLQRWQSFQTAEPDLYATLMAQCEGAFKRRQTSSD
jgi:hypothetical protein